MKIGSLFDGSGGFPLAASLCGIEPVWAAEIEPYPIAVTRSRFPNMKHLGSVTDVRGDEVEPVDVITFGSPCQDLSVAGKRAGLKHTENGDDETTRSGLFMEAVRIIKEMRNVTNGKYPRYAIWENVPGAFSSNKGLDFRVVLEELIRIAEPTAVMPEVPKAGWPYADVYCGDGWSLAYRVLDAQYWGVPQRRRRIYLVADFRGQRAGKISFEREGLRGYFAQSGAQREAVAGDAENCSGAADCAGSGVIPYTLKIRGGVEVDSAGKAAGKGALIQNNLSATLGVSQDQYLFQPVCSSGEVAGTLDASYFKGCGMRQGVEREYVVQPVVAAGFKAGQSMAGSVGWQEECAATLASACSGTEPTVYIKEQHLFENHSQDSRYKGPLDVCPMLPAQLGTGGNNQPFVVEGSPVYCLQGNGIDRADTAGCNGRGWNDETCYTLNTIDRPAVAYAEDVAGVDCRNFTEHEELYPTLQAKPNGGQSLNYSGAVRVRYIVRRLTPTECARLQGFPDDWAHPDVKDSLTDDEYAFWLNVRNTHAAINGKAVKDYTRDQMLTWYSKLHTDSAEYKLWGNGIALPCALYVMQGIAEVQNEN
ncbi:MAG: DNA cytosine methyltransferase [Bacteroidaceae bacterium]|nr:DNA cytosine methyltransferase [Bacteroidaceae bacterium]